MELWFRQPRACESHTLGTSPAETAAPKDPLVILLLNLSYNGVLPRERSDGKGLPVTLRADAWLDLVTPFTHVCWRTLHAF
jgi:hypothetical protein